jgi:hypothetical protein
MMLANAVGIEQSSLRRRLVYRAPIAGRSSRRARDEFQDRLVGTAQFHFSHLQLGVSAEAVRHLLCLKVPKKSVYEWALEHFEHKDGKYLCKGNARSGPDLLALASSEHPKVYTRTRSTVVSRKRKRVDNISDSL